MSELQRILVVEDDRASREYLVYLLEHAGYQVQSAADGEEALEIVRSSPPALIISDILMSGVDGLQLVQKLRKQPAFAHIPVVFCSATYRQEEAQTLMESMGVVKRIDKPAQPQMLLKAVEEALAQPAPTASFDSTLYSEQHLQLVSGKLMQKIEALTAANLKLDETRKRLEEEMRFRRKIEEKLCESESRLHQITACAPVGIYQTLPSGECVFVNDWWMATTGLTIEQCMGWGWLQAVHPAEREQVSAALGKMFVEEREYEAEFRILTPANQTRWVITRTVPLKGIDGSKAGYVGMVLDITERRSLEEQLRQSQKMEAVGRLVSGVAHDFNNLLAIIMGNTELALLRQQEGDPVARKLTDVKAATEKAASLIRQLLMYNRQGVSDPRKVELNPAISVSCRFLRRLIGENIVIKLNLTEEPATVFIDPGHLEQIMMNLLVNARDALPDGGTVTIETSVVDLRSEPLDPQFAPNLGKYAMLAVGDTGKGMDAATRARIFEPFFTTKEKGKGSGLGLAMVDGIVRQAGGHIAVYSEVGRGTTFKILLPLSSAIEEPAQPDQKELQPGNGETILVVEDDPSLRAMVRECLLESGYNVLEAADGVEALKAAQRYKEKIDLLLSDVVMPRMGGAKLVNEFSAKHPAAQIVMMTGHIEDLTLGHNLLRTVRVINKPFTRSSLLRSIRTVLDAAQQQASTTSKRHTILLAEDDPGYRELIADTLQSSGFEVLPSNDGTRAVLQGVTRHIDLAILDVEMPKRSGYSVCRKLRSNPSTARVPIIVMSALATKDDQQLAMEAGANLFLRKPFSTEELVSNIRALLVNRQAASR